MFKPLSLLLCLTASSALAQAVYPPIIPQTGTNLLPLNNTWTGQNTIGAAVIGAGNAAGFWYPTYNVGFDSNPGNALILSANRILVGEAALYFKPAAEPIGNSSEWVTQVLGGGTVDLSQLASVSAIGGLAITGAARSSDWQNVGYSNAYGTASGGSEGGFFFGYNDDTTGLGSPIALGAQLWGAAKAGCTNCITLGSQVVISNAGTVVQMTPHSGVTAGTTIGMLVTPFNTGGGPFTSSVSAGMVFGAGSAGLLMERGIVFIYNSFDTTCGATLCGTGGAGVAIDHYAGQSDRWLNAVNTVDGEIYANDTNGLTLIGHGAGSYDVVLSGQVGTAAYVPAATTNFNVVGTLLVSGPTESTTGSNLALGNTIVASANCGSLSGAVGCWKFFIGSTAHYAPIW